MKIIHNNCNNWLRNLLQSFVNIPDQEVSIVSTAYVHQLSTESGPEMLRQTSRYKYVFGCVFVTA